MKSEGPHAGIRIDKIPVGAGIGGLIFAVGSVAIFLIGLPMLLYFVAGAAALGIGVALMLRSSSLKSRVVDPRPCAARWVYNAAF